MADKKENPFVLLEKMDKFNLEILKFLAEEISLRLQRGDDGKTEISTTPDGFLSLVELKREPMASHNWIKDAQERKNDIKWAISFFKKLGAIEKYEYVADKIKIEANEKKFGSSRETIKEKYENIIQKEKPSEFFCCRGALFHWDDIAYHPETKERRVLLEKLWSQRQEIKDNIATIPGIKTPTDDCMVILGLSDKIKTRNVINKIESSIQEKCKQITIDGSCGDGYLMTIDFGVTA